MAVLKRELHRSVKGPAMSDEDWWHLVFDTDTKRLYIEHEWHHVDVRGDREPDIGRTELEIAEYLTQGGQTAGHRELWRLLRGIFNDEANPE
jgi:hypothetical protein